MTKHPFILIAALVAGIACSPAATPPTVPADLGLSMAAADASQANTWLLGKAVAPAVSETLRIKRASLGKPLIYIAAVMRTSKPDSAYRPYQPRLVTFTQEGSYIFLSDIRPNQRYTENATLPRIIAQFPIVSMEVDGITFDFATGMKDVFTFEQSYSEDDAQSPVAISFPLHTFITQQHATVDTLSLDHHYTVRKNDIPHTFVMRHVFKRDTPQQFEPREADSTNTYGYYTTPPWYEFRSDLPHHHIERWDIRRPITVGLSPGIPPLIRPAILDAITGWNRVFGREILVLSETSADRGPLDLRHDIVINWITNDADGTAIGHMMAHPVTGEILHGDVVLTSGRFLRTANNVKHMVPKLKTKPPAPDGFESAQACIDIESENKQLTLTLPSAADLQAQFIGRLFQQVVTHELGHVLGLRHNFAASTEGGLTHKTTKEFMQQLAEGQPVDNAPLPASSVMDYLDNNYRLFMTRPGPYDEAAIRWGYLSSSGTPAVRQFRYCTDENANDYAAYVEYGTVGDMADCQRFDFGPDPFIDVIGNLDGNIADYLFELADLAAKPAEELAAIPLLHLPSEDYIMEDLYRLQNYSLGKMLVWTLDDHVSIERIAAAARYLKQLRSYSYSEDPMIKATRDGIDAQINHGDKAAQLRAVDAQLRLSLGVQKLEMLLDAPVGSLNKNGDGTPADIHFGD